MKLCKKCLQAKPISDFYTDAARRSNDGLYPWCKPCKRGYMKGRYVLKNRMVYERDARLLKRYGKTWDELVAIYGTSCNIGTAPGFVDSLT